MKRVFNITFFIAAMVLLMGQVVGQSDSRLDTNADTLVRQQALFVLEKNNQAPFETIKNFRFTLLHSRDMNLSIYDLAGNKVRTLVSEQLKPGVHDFTWDGTDSKGSPVKSGVYRYSLKTQDDEQSHVIAYLR